MKMKNTSLQRNNLMKIFHSKMSKLIIMVLVTICMVVAFPSAVQGATLGISANKEKIGKGEEITITVSWGENVSAARNGLKI